MQQVRRVGHHTHYDGCVLQLDRDEEWYNIPTVVRQWLRHVTAENEAQRLLLAELQARQKEERESLREWSEHVTQRDQEVALKLQSFDALVGKARHEADTGVDSLRHAVGDCLQQLTVLRDDVAALKRKDLSLHTELYKVVDEATSRSLADAKDRWAAMEASLFRAVDAVKGITEEKLSAFARATTEQLSATGEKLRLVTEEAAAAKSSAAQGLAATKKGLVDELVALSNRLTSLDRIVDGHEKTVTVLHQRSDACTKLLEDDFTQLPRRLAQMEEATRLSLRDLEMRQQDLKDEHGSKISSLGRDVDAAEVKQIGRVEALRKELSNEIEDLRDATVRFTTQQSVYNNTFSQKLEHTERFVGISSVGAGGSATKSSRGTAQGASNSANTSGAYGPIVSASTSTAFETPPRPATPSRPSGAYAQGAVDAAGTPLEELVRRVACSVIAPATISLEARMEQVAAMVAQGRADARTDIDSVKQQTLEFCQRSIFDSMSSVRGEVAATNSLLTLELSSVRNLLDQSVAAAEADRTAVARLISESQTQSQAVAEQIKRTEARAAASVALSSYEQGLQVARDETDTKLRQLKADVSEQLARIRQDVEQQALQGGEKHARLRQDLVSLFEEREAAAADAVRLSKHSLNQNVEALVADGVRRSAEAAQVFAAEKAAAVKDAVLDVLRARCAELEASLTDQFRSLQAARASCVDAAMDQVQHDVSSLKTQIEALNTVIGQREDTVAKLVRAANGAPDHVLAQLAPLREELSNLRLVVSTVQADVAVIQAKASVPPPGSADTVGSSSPPGRKASRSNLVLPPAPAVEPIVATPLGFSKEDQEDESRSDVHITTTRVTTTGSQFSYEASGPVALDFSTVSAISPQQRQPAPSKEGPKVFMNDSESFSEQARRLRQDVNDIISRIKNMDLVLREIEVVFTEKVEDVAGSVYTKAQIDERFETHWHSIVTLLSRKEDQASLDVKLEAAVRQCGSDARMLIREALSKIYADLEGKVTMGDMTAIFAARNASVH